MVVHGEGQGQWKHSNTMKVNKKESSLRYHAKELLGSAGDGFAKALDHPLKVLLHLLEVALDVVEVPLAGGHEHLYLLQQHVNGDESAERPSSLRCGYWAEGVDTYLHELGVVLILVHGSGDERHGLLALDEPSSQLLQGGLDDLEGDSARLVHVLELLHCGR
jgi:hypothetical protein